MNDSDEPTLFPDESGSQQQVASSATELYDPRSWPRWLRWCLTAPFSLLAAIIAFFVYSIVNNFLGSELPSAVTGLFAILIGSSAFVFCGRYIAPSFNRYVGYTLGVAVLAVAGYYAGMVVSAGSGTLPKWYAFIIPLAAAGGAIYACASDLSDPTQESAPDSFAWMPNLLRWLAFIPVALLLSLLSIFALGLPLGFLNVNSELIRLLNTPITAAVFIAVAAAIAPRYKKTVSLTLGVLIALFPVFLLVTAFDRPLTTQILSRLLHQDPNDLHFYMSDWYQILSATSALAGIVIANLAVFEAAKGSKGQA